MRSPGFPLASTRSVVKWVLLTVTALALGGLLGTGYGVMSQSEPAEPVSPARADVTPPTTPQPIDPDDGAVTNTTPVFTWTASEDDYTGFVYELEFSMDPDFESGVQRRVLNLRDTEWVTPDDEAFVPGITYYWRVFAIDVGLNLSPYSDVHEFTAFGVPPVVAPELPDPPRVFSE